MARTNTFKDDYIKFMKELTSKGYAKESSKVAESGSGWYLPHHGGYNPNKPGKYVLHSILVQNIMVYQSTKNSYLDQI